MDDTPNPGDGLLAETVLAVRPEWRPGQRPAYHVLDRRGDLVARGRYVADDVLRPMMANLGLRHRTAAALEVVDRRQSPVFTVVFPGFRARSVMLVRDGNGEEVGAAVRTSGRQRARYELRSQGRVVGAVHVVNLRQSEVHLLDGRGAVVGTIRNLGHDPPFDLPADGDGHWLELHQAVEEPLRTMLVACTVALQAAIGSESTSGEIDVVRLPLLPPRFDRLRRQLGG